MATLRPQEQASGKYLCLDGELGRFFFYCFAAVCWVFTYVFTFGDVCVVAHATRQRKRETENGSKFKAKIIRRSINLTNREKTQNIRVEPQVN